MVTLHGWVTERRMGRRPGTMERATNHDGVTEGNRTPDLQGHNLAL